MTSTNIATGAFDVTLTPRSPEGDSSAAIIGRMSIHKRYSGDLEGTADGEMLAVRPGADGSAGYVAMEVVAGSLLGRSGTFILQHSGTMTRGTGVLTVTVVPDSGTGELEGISGHMQIEIEDGRHAYIFAYVIDEGE